MQKPDNITLVIDEDKNVGKIQSGPGRLIDLIRD
jgi:hypothetical protein